MSAIVDCVVLNWKDTPRTVRCVESLLTEPGVGRIIVVDNESDGSVATAIGELGAANVDLIEQAENRGFAAGVNPGLRQALAGSARAVLCINNDAYLEPGALALLSAALDADPTTGMVAPTVKDLSGAVLSTGGTFRPATMSTNDVGRGSPDYLTWACVLLDQRLLEQIGLLDEQFFMYWEDVEFGRRAIAAGFHPAVVAEAVARHEISSSHGRAGAKISFYSTLGLVVLGRKLGGAAIIGTVYRVFGRWATALVRRDFASAHAVIRGARLGASIKSPAFHQTLEATRSTSR